MNKIRTGDEVIVIAGKDKGKQGTLTKIMNNGRCLVTGVQLVKKHTKPNPQAGIQGGILEQESSISLSNIAIYNASSKKADKVSIQTKDDGSRVRLFKSTGKEIK